MADDTDRPFLIESPAEREIREQAEKRSRENRARNLQLLFNGILATFTILTAGIVLYQNHVLNLSLIEAKRQAGAAIDSAQAAKDAVGVARDTLNSGIGNFQQEQRAWISATPSITGDPAAGVPWKIKITMGSHGATPALRVLPRAFVKGYAPTKETIDGKLNESPAATDVAPRQESSQFFSTEFSPPNVAAIISGQISLYAFGTIHYKDVFGVPRMTQFCAVYNPRMKVMELCENFNRME